MRAFSFIRGFWEHTNRGGDIMDSIWQKTSEKRSFSALKGDMKTDVLIIGGGLAGILCAYMLSEAGVDNMLVEASEICSGVTKNTTAKLTFQHGLIYDKLIRSLGEERAAMYLSANRSALEKYRELCADIDCNFEEKSSFVYSLYSRRKIEREVAALRRLGCNAEFMSDTMLPFPVAGAVRVDRQAQFDPLRFVYAISEGLNIFENTKVRALTPKGAITSRGKIRAEKIIIATHFPILNKHGGYFIKMYQDRSYVIALKNAQDVGGMYIDESGKGLSFRNYQGQLLLGGGSHRTGKNGGGWRELEAVAKNMYPDAKITARWATQDCMTLDSVPYIGRYSKSAPNLYVATGFNKWGMTSSMVAAQILSGMIIGTTPDCAAVFSPSRSILHPQLLANAFETTVGLLTPTVPRCPHLGCALKYNKQEHSWDCPCHGSRFEKDGRLLDGPATDDKRM